MNIQSDKPKMIYKYKTKDGKEFYSIGLSKKKQDGTYENGFMSCKFKKGIKLENKTEIMIKGGWINFDIKDKKTYPFIFINEFEIVEPKQEEVNEFSAMKTTTEYKEDEVTLTDEDIDKVFDNQMDLPF